MVAKLHLVYSSVVQGRIQGDAGVAPPSLEYKLICISSQRNTENKTFEDAMTFFWSSLDFGGGLDDERRTST